MPNRTQSLPATYFDGTSARAHGVQLTQVDAVLLVHGEGIDLQVPLQAVQWPERTHHGKRVAHFADGGLVQTADSVAWDAWCAANGRQESMVVKMQQSWRWVVGSVLVLVTLLAAIQTWALPVMATAVVAALPLTVDTSLGEATLLAIDKNLMQSSQLDATEQSRLRTAFSSSLAALPAGSVPTWTLVFRKSLIGPNALALPGGTIILTDELVELVAHDEQVITAVLAHELGHVQHRDGLRMLVQVSVLGGLGSLVLGDFSSMLSAVPVILGQAHYSREAEHAADVYCVEVLKAASISPTVMVTLFDKLEQHRRDKGKMGDSWLGLAFASHPSGAARIQYFEQAARSR